MRLCVLRKTTLVAWWIAFSFVLHLAGSVEKLRLIAAGHPFLVLTTCLLLCARVLRLHPENRSRSSTTSLVVSCTGSHTR